MADVEVEAVCVEVRLATEAELAAVRAARAGEAFEPPAGRQGFRLVLDDDDQHDTAGHGGAGALSVVGQAHVEFLVDGRRRQWAGAEWHGHTIPAARDATLDLLALIDEIRREGTIALLVDMRIAGLPVSRWDLFSAPQIVSLDPGLADHLEPLRRG